MASDINLSNVREKVQWALRNFIECSKASAITSNLEQRAEHLMLLTVAYRLQAAAINNTGDPANGSFSREDCRLLLEDLRQLRQLFDRAQPGFDDYIRNLTILAKLAIATAALTQLPSPPKK